jgi:hypothetical protein
MDNYHLFIDFPNYRFSFFPRTSFYFEGAALRYQILRNTGSSLYLMGQSQIKLTNKPKERRKKNSSSSNSLHRWNFHCDTYQTVASLLLEWGHCLSSPGREYLFMIITHFVLFVTASNLFPSIIREWVTVDLILVQRRIWNSLPTNFDFFFE